MKWKEGDILVNEQKDKNAHAGKRNYTDTANEYKDRIPNKVYQALINWIPDYI